jgi:hypothetical protein
MPAKRNDKARRPAGEEKSADDGRVGERQKADLTAEYAEFAEENKGKNSASSANSAVSDF